LQSFHDITTGLSLSPATMKTVISKYHYEIGESSVPYNILEFLEANEVEGKSLFDLRFVLPFQVPKLGPDEDVGRPYLSEECIAALDVTDD
jgi:hypothetical protein